MTEARHRDRPRGASALAVTDPPNGALPLESFFATPCDDPLAGAFTGKRAVHPFTGMSPVDPADLPAHWARMHGAPRSGRTVAYVHIPFCENHCLFCGFYQNPWRADDGAPYVDAVIAQIRAFAETPARDGPPLQAVYLGGGTPTALSASDIARLVGAIRRHLPLVADCEITLEGRIHSFDIAKARAACDAGVSRISLGVQSFSEAIRRPLGRKAGHAEVTGLLADLVRLDRAAVVVDLIYGLPGQHPEDVAEDVRLCAGLGLDGLDLYSLNLIPGTPLLAAIEKGKMRPADAATLGAAFTAGEEAAEAEGWHSISTTHWQGSLRERNVYNLAIKTGADCLAFGAGAGGFMHGLNYRITSDLGEFAARGGDAGACLTRGMMRQPDCAPITNAIKAGMERGLLDLAPATAALARLRPDGRKGLAEHLAPLLAQWTETGLLQPFHRFHRLTRAGRFWQVAMTGRLIGWLGQHPDLKELT